ncbi:MAG: SHOCT domain-containing protein [Dehalococcoidia bacterium]|nr:MAG: SHOCT domain-containing protein [Dehalococcoidia bacterium]
MGWWMVFMGVFWVLFWGSLIFLAIAAISRSGGGGASRERDGGDGASAIEIARRRLARGEITPDQFQEIRRHLEAGPPQPT